MSFDETMPFQSPPPPKPIDQWAAATTEQPDIKSALMDPDLDITTLLSYSWVVAAYRNQSPELQAKLLSLDSISELISLISTSPDKKILRTIIELFMSQNKGLLQAVSESSDNMEDLSRVLMRDDENDLFRIGLTTQIFSTAVKKWPSDVFQLMMRSESCFPTILANLGNDAVFSMVMLFAQTPPAWFHAFLWGFVSAYVSERIRLPAPPQGWNVHMPGIENCVRVELGSQQKQRVVQALAAFFKAFPDEREFKSVIVGLIPFMLSTSFVPAELQQILELGLLLPTIPKLVSSALDIIDDRIAHFQLTEKALAYLTYAYDGLRIEPIVNFLFRVLSPDKIDQSNAFVLKAATKLVSKMMERAPYPRFFAKVTQHCIAYVWNRRQAVDNLMYRSVILEIATIVGDTPSWDGWKQFETDVVGPFSQRAGFDRETKISEENWDKPLIEKLRTQSSTIEMTPADRKPVYETISDDDFSDSRSAESGSYATNQSDVSDSDVLGSMPHIPTLKKPEIAEVPIVATEAREPSNIPPISPMPAAVPPMPAEKSPKKRQMSSESGKSQKDDKRCEVA